MKHTRRDPAMLSPRRKFLCQVAGAAASIARKASPGARRAEAAGELRGALDAEPVRVGKRKQLFVDDYVVAETADVSRELGIVTKANQGKPIMRADKPWEDGPITFSFYVTVVHDGQRFRMWYRARDNPVPLVAYAESDDGLAWRKPSLGISNYAGVGTENNLTDFIADGFNVFDDPHETDPAHRYKAAYKPTTAPYHACLAHSADGLRWKLYNQGQPVTGRAADFSNQVVWDEDAGLYRLFTRTDFGAAGGPDEIRGVRGMTNRDLKANPTDWKAGRSWRLEREGHEEYKRRQIYHLTDWIYEGVHFGLLLAYEWPLDMSEGGADHHKRHERDILNFYVITSRDAEHWDLRWVYAQKPLIPRGSDGSFDKDMVIPSFNILTLRDQHWIYYTGCGERHSVAVRHPAIGLGTLRLDGFVCLEAREKVGTVTTKPFRLDGKSLQVNLDARQGELRVEVLDAAGQAIPGYDRDCAKPLAALDGVRLTARWDQHDDLAGLVGSTVRLRFFLKNARLYSFQLV